MRLRPKKMGSGPIGRALRWLIERNRQGDGAQRADLHLQADDPMNIAAAIEVSVLDKRLDGLERPESSDERASSNVASSPDATSGKPPRSPSGDMPPPIFSPWSPSRRAALRSLGFGAVGVAVLADFRVLIGMSDFLRDGSVKRVSLDGALLHAPRNTLFQVVHTAGWQVIYLSGLAVIQVFSVSQRPILVVTKLGQIVATSAQFEVLAEDMLDVSVRRGQVRVVPAGNDGTDYLVGAGKRVLVRGAGSARVESIASAEVDRKFNWTSGQLSSEFERVGDVAKRLNRFNVLQLRPSREVASLAVGQYHGKVNEPYDFVELLEGRGLKTRRRGNDIFIFKSEEE